VQQRLLQRFDGQDQGAASVCRHRPINAPSSSRTRGGRSLAARRCLVGRGDGKDS
jgi:hypothetical protein